MALNGIGPVRIDKTEVELVPKLKHLGLMISMKDTTSEDIRVRLATSDFVDIWKDDDTNISWKKRFVHSHVWSMAQCGSESWTLPCLERGSVWQ